VNEFSIIKEKTCAVTGHRVILEGFNEENLKTVFLELIDAGYDTFLNGMALGFDSLCFRILEDIRQERNIKIIACIPCKTQDKGFSIKDKREYERMVCSADKVILVSEKYTPFCMQKRNIFMVDNCSKLVAYLRKDKGGTKNTVTYADKKEVEIIRV